MKSFLRGIALHRFLKRSVREAARRMQLPGKRSRTKKIGCPEKKYAAGDAEETDRYIGFL